MKIGKQIAREIIYGEGKSFVLMIAKTSFEGVSLFP